MSSTVFYEREVKAISGFLMLLLTVVLAVVSVVAIGVGGSFHSTALVMLGIIIMIFLCILPAGFKILHPNEARVFTLFGNYYGTLRRSGFYYVNPFVVSTTPTSPAGDRTRLSRNAGTAGIEGRKAISLKTQTLDNGLQKVNDVLGNPIVIGAIVIWRVENPTQAVFAVEHYSEYLKIQTDSTIRNTTRLYPYDVFSEDEHDEGVKEKTLRGSSLEIAQTMQAELMQRVDDAGLIIEEVRITHLAYAEEIAAAMLQRQQASAIIAARQKIVDGAVGMVKMALDKLSEDGIVVLDEERKAAMISNLLVVLCGNRDAQPIVNSGSIY